MQNIYVRDVRSNDLDAISEIEKSCFSHPWKYADFEKAMTDKQLFKVVTVGDDIAGYLLALVVCDEAQVQTVAVKEEFRGKGCGWKVLEASIFEAMIRRCSMMYLEVRKSNAKAISLYENMGFKQMGERRNFYTAPQEDAITMSFDIKEIVGRYR